MGHLGNHNGHDLGILVGSVWVRSGLFGYIHVRSGPFGSAQVRLGLFRSALVRSGVSFSLFQSVLVYLGPFWQMTP